MLSTSSRLRIQRIIRKLSNGEDVTLQERILITKYADRDQTVSSWLTRAQRLQQNNMGLDSIDNLISNLDLGSSEPNASYNPDKDDLGEWFSGAPSWLGRS